MDVPAFFSVTDFVKRHANYLTISRIRKLLFVRDTNGLTASGAIVRMGGRLLIDEPKFIAWLRAQPAEASASRCGRPKKQAA